MKSIFLAIQIIHNILHILKLCWFYFLYSSLDLPTTLTKLSLILKATEPNPVIDWVGLEWIGFEWNQKMEIVYVIFD